MIEEIKLSDNISIYKTNIEYDKDILKKEINLNIDVNAKSYRYSNEQYPGLQSTIIIESNEIKRITDLSLNILKENIGHDVKKPFFHKAWAYISDNKNKHTFYHKHNTFEDFNLINIEWAYTFYVQMPDNLENDDGFIYFKTDDGLEYGLLPKEGDIIFFPAHLLHMPKNNKKSTIDRIVLGWVFKNLDINEKIISKNKSLL